MSDTFKNILFLVLLLAIVGLGYYLYSKQGLAVLNLNDEAQVSANLQQESALFISSLNTLRQVDLQTELFSEPKFKSLQSFTTPVPEIESGRNDPFRPVVQ